MREHRRLTLLLNVLLTARVSFEPRRSEHFWAHVPAAEGTGGLLFSSAKSVFIFLLAQLLQVIDIASG